VTFVEQRGSERTRLWLPIRLRTQSGDALAVTYDVSDGGVLLLAAKKLEIGDKIVLTFDVPDEPRRLTAKGHVVHSSQNQADPDGIWPHKLGVALDDCPPEFLVVINNLRRSSTLPPPPESRRP
jgi:Tfp pilus assembly protein PilZ